MTLIIFLIHLRIYDGVNIIPHAIMGSNHYPAIRAMRHTMLPISYSYPPVSNARVKGNPDSREFDKLQALNEKSHDIQLFD